jgi:transposase
LIRFQKEREKKREVLLESYALKTVLDKQNDRISKLESMLKKDSSMSDKPPSADPLFVKAKATSTKEKSDKNVGGQKGHKGHYLKPKNPDIIIDKKPPEHCPHCNGEMIIDNEYEPRQIIDIKVEVITTEERSFVGTCCNCGLIVEGEFSKGFNSPVGYGPSLKTIVSTLNTDSNVTINKVAQFISSLTDGQINMSHGTVVNIIKSLATKLKPSINDITLQLASCSVLNVDETGVSINGDLTWMQIIANKDLSLFGRNPKRGTLNDAMDKLLLLFTGNLMHDHLKSYYKYDHLTHSECNSHSGRYLNAVDEIMKHPWAKAMADLLVETNNQKKALQAKNIHNMNDEQLNDIRIRYLNILDQGQSEYDEAISGKIHTSYYDEERRLLKRLREYTNEHLRFILNFDVPFTNNIAEHGARYIKGKKKVSNCFRSDSGCDNYATIASVLDTLRKQNLGIFSSINSVFKGEDLRFIHESHQEEVFTPDLLLDSS